ncbi:MAG: Ig-like domain-containing protein [Clostridia bacterium]|nr:Ig-like domain-containing protein [Clostridia bacterium]
MKKRLLCMLVMLTLLVTSVLLGVVAFATSGDGYVDAMAAIAGNETLEAKKIETVALAEDGHLGIPVDATVYFDAASFDVTAGEGGTTLIFYIINTRTERVGTQSDVSIIASLLDKGYVVAVVDYHNHAKAVSPEIEWSTQAVGQTLLTGAFFESAEIKAQYAETFIVPAGHTLARDLVYWELDRHSRYGTMEQIVSVWNNDFRGVKGKAIIPWHNDGVRKSTQNGFDGTAPVWYSEGTGDGAVTYGGVSYVPDENGLYIMVKHTLATDVTDCVKPDGSPIDLNLYMHIVYPTNPSDNVPVFALASSSQHLAGGAIHAGRPHTYGFAFEGYAVAMYDFAYVPMARDDHYGYFDGSSSGAVTKDSYTYALGIYNEALFPTAALRYIRMLALTQGETFAFNGDIGVLGNSKGSYVTRLADLDLMEVRGLADGYTEETLLTYAHNFILSFPEGRQYHGHHGETRYDEKIETYTKNGTVIDGGEMQPWLVYNGEMIPSGAQFVLSSCGSWDNTIDGNYAPLMTTGHIGIENNGYSTNNQLINAGCVYDIPLVWFELVLGHTFLQRENNDWGADPYVVFKNYANYVLKDGAPSVICTLPLAGEEISVSTCFDIKFAGIISESEIQKVTLTDTKGNIVPGTFESAYGRTQWTFIPAKALDGGEKYTLTVPDTIVGENGTALASTYRATYFTEEGSTQDLGVTSPVTVTNDSGMSLTLTVPKIKDYASIGANRIELRLLVTDDAANTLEVYLDNADGALLGAVPIGGAGYYSIDPTGALADMGGKTITLFVRSARAATDATFGGDSLWTENFEDGKNNFSVHSSSPNSLVEMEGHGKVLSLAVAERSKNYYANVQVLSRTKFVFGTSNPVTTADYGRRFVIRFDVYDTVSRYLNISMNHLSNESSGVVDYDRDFTNFRTTKDEWTTCTFIFSIEDPAYGKTALNTKTFYLFADSTGDTLDQMFIDNFTVCELVSDVTIGSASLVVTSAGGDAYKSGNAQMPFVVNGANYKTLKEAISAVGTTEGTITLVGNVTLTDTDVLKDILSPRLTLDLNGYAIRTNIASASLISLAGTEGTITIKNGSLYLSGGSLVGFENASASQGVSVSLEDVYIGTEQGADVEELLVNSNASVASTLTLSLVGCDVDMRIGRFTKNPVVMLPASNDTLTITTSMTSGSIVLSRLDKTTLFENASEIVLCDSEDGFTKLYLANSRTVPATMSLRTDIGTISVKETDSETVRQGYREYMPTPAGIKTPYGYIPEIYEDKTLYPWVVFHKDTSEFVTAGDIFYADTKGANGVLGALEGKTGNYVVYLRDNFTYSTVSQNWSSLNCNILVDLNDKVFTYTGRMRPQSKATGAMSIVFMNGEICANSAYPLLDVIVKTKEKSFDFTFRDVTFSVAEGCTLPTYWVSSVNAATNTGKLNYSLTLQDCRFLLPESGTSYVFSNSANANIEDHVTIKGCEFVGAFYKTFYLYRGLGKNDLSSISIEKGADGRYMTNTRTSEGLEYVLTHLADGTKPKLYFTNPLKIEGDATTFEYSELTASPSVSFVSAYLNLASEINLIYRTYVAPGAENPSVTFRIGDYEKTVTTYTVDENGLYLFKLTGITPAMMHEVVTATLTANVGGKTVSATHDTLSVAVYLAKLQESCASDNKMMTLLDALLVYGAAAQQYVDKNTNGFTEDIIAKLGALSAIDESEGVYTKTGVGFEKFALRLDGAFALRVGIVLPEGAEASRYTLEATKDGVTRTYRLTDGVVQDGIISVVVYDICASELDTEITIELKEGDSTVGTLSVSANAYLFCASQSTIDGLAPLAKAIYAYGVAASAYAG